MSSYPYACEHPKCTRRVPLTTSEYNRLGALCPEHQSAAPKPTVCKPPPAKWKACCDACGTTSNPRKHHTLNPRNLHPAYALLCLPCGKQLGYTPVDYGRTLHGPNGIAA